MRDEQIDENEDIAPEMVWEDERAKFAFCDALVEDSSVGCEDFNVGWSRTGGGKMGKQCFFCHDSGVRSNRIQGEENNAMLRVVVPQSRGTILGG
jgi:hypothetical protein